MKTYTIFLILTILLFIAHKATRQSTHEASNPTSPLVVESTDLKSEDSAFASGDAGVGTVNIYNGSYTPIMTDELGRIIVTIKEAK